MINEKMMDSAMELARGYVEKNAIRFGFFPRTETEAEHVARMIASALQTKYGFGYPGGSFVTSVVNNDLHGAIANADSVNQRAISLIVAGFYNIGLQEIEDFVPSTETMK